MLRRGRGFRPGFALLVLGVGPVLFAAAARADEDARNAQDFVQGLRDRGYFDLATEYLERIKTQADTPAEYRVVIDYELGRLLVDEASRSGDLVRKQELLEQARERLNAFSKANPSHAKATDALAELGRLLGERGHLAMLVADEFEGKEREGKLAEARGFLDQSRAAYVTAEEKLKAAFAKYPPFIPEGDPKKDEKERVHTSLMVVQLQKATIDYEQGETYPLGSAERNKALTDGITQFENLYKSYRQQMVGLTARMMQGKCYEEQGELGKAMGIYNELMEHADARLRPLQRYVGYFRIIVLGKRKEFALAADEADRWLKANRAPELQRSKEGLGVQFELAKNIIAQLPEIQNEPDKTRATKIITDTLTNVVKYSSPFKVDALNYLKKYKPTAAANAMDVAKMNYDDAVLQGEQALASQEWDRAIPMFRQAIKKAETAHDIDKTNYARYNLAFGYYMAKRYYDAEVLAEHLARRYPQGGLSPKAAELAMASLGEAYNTYTQIDRTTDLNNLIEVAKYTSEAFAEMEQGDTAKMTLGQIYHGTGRYDKAIESYESVRQKSARSIESKTKVGSSYWEKSRLLRNDAKNAEADAAQAKAIESLTTALKAREDAHNPPTDAGLIGNACDIADIYLEVSKPEEALKLLDPLAKKQGTATGPAYNRLMSALLRAHVGVSQTDLAMADMAALEKAGGGGNLTQLYFSLGKLLEQEMERLKKKGDSAGLNRTKQAYLKFLGALAGSKSGQTYDSLQWAGENMLKLGNAKDAEPVFKNILETYEKDQKFLAAPGSGDRMLRTRLRLSAALRGNKNFKDAEALINDLIKENPKVIDPQMEKGLLLEDLAASRKGKWSEAQAHWRTLALRLGNARTKPEAYYDAWYHAALALKEEGKGKEAKQTLASVMRLSANVGGPEMKQKYKTLLDQIK
jgi:cellulose synthase operon protein C